MLALVAVTLLSLRSVCEQWFTHLGGVAAATQSATLAAHAPVQHDLDATADCCATATDPNAVAPLQAAIAGLQLSQGLAPAALVAILTGSTIFTRQPHRLRAPPRSPQSFYLRSARILR